MGSDRRLLTGMLGLALMAAACGSSSSSASPAPAASQPTAATGAPSSSTAATAAAPSGPDASFGAGAASDLEAMLPDAAGGITFKKESFDGAGVGAAAMGMDTGALAPILAANGKSISDVRMAIASPVTPSATTNAIVIALQIRGVDATKFVSLVSSTASGDLSPATVGGKQVLKTGTAGVGVVVYTKGDVLFEVLLAGDTIEEAIVAALP